MTRPTRMGAAQGSVRRRPLVVSTVVGLIALVFVAGLVSRSALAADLTAAHEDTHVYLDGMSGTEVGAAGTTATHAGGVDDETAVKRARVGLRLHDVEINGLCLVAGHDVTGIGRISAVITAGEPVDGTVTGEDVVKLDALDLDVSALKGDARDLEGLTLGASDPAATGGAPGAFGVTADSLALDALNLDSGALDLSSGATLPGLQVKTVTGTADRSDCT